MTRFARAKGSKSSNEKKPEEATSWCEMKNAMLSKKLNKSEQTILEKEIVKVNDTPKATEWASLGSDAFDESLVLVKNHLHEKNNSSEEIKKGKKKNKILSNSQMDENLCENSKSKKKAKKSKVVETDDGLDVNVQEKEKKRKATESDYQGVVLKKKKKLSKTDGKKSGLEENKIQKSEHTNDKETICKNDNKKFKNIKSGIKLKNTEKENDKGSKFKSKKQGNHKGGKKLKNKNLEKTKSPNEELIINGEKIPITKFQGFFITLEDAERLKELRNEMKKQRIPKAKIESAIKLERRRAEKALSRLKKSVCFHCRGHGHLLSNCPKLFQSENTATGICYKCGSTEHSATECKVVRGTSYQFAECFICKEQGHIARQCPDNPRGLYPQGGACRECGDVTHLRKDCPKIQAQKAEEIVTVRSRSDRDLECLDEEIASREKQNLKKNTKQNSIVKF